MVRDWVCDGDRDCDDGSDEENCEEVRDTQEVNQINLEQAKSISIKAAKPAEPAQDDKDGNTGAVKLISLEEAKNMSREAPFLKSTLKKEEEIKCDLETMFDCGPGEIGLKVSQSNDLDVTFCQDTAVFLTSECVTIKTTAAPGKTSPRAVTRGETHAMAGTGAAVTSSALPHPVVTGARVTRATGW